MTLTLRNIALVAEAGHPKLAAAFRFLIAGAHTYAIYRNLK